jgi:ATP-binding cassette subfamily F protein uup
VAAPAAATVAASAAVAPGAPAVPAPGSATATPKPRKLSFKDQRELEEIPKTILRLEAEQAQLTAAIGDPESFRRDPAAAATAARRLEAIVKELEISFARWEALEAS